MSQYKVLPSYTDLTSFNDLQVSVITIIIWIIIWPSVITKS